MTWIGPDYDDRLGIVLPGLTAISFPRLMTDANIEILITAFPHLSIYFDGGTNFNTDTSDGTPPTGDGTTPTDGLGNAIFRILALSELDDAQIIRIRRPTTNGKYEECGTKIETLARYIRGVLEGENWRSRLGLAATDTTMKRTITIDENGFANYS